MSEIPAKKPRWGTRTSFRGAGFGRAANRRGRGLLRNTRFQDDISNSNGNTALPPVASPTNLKKLRIIHLDGNDEYPGWKLYFPDEAYNQSNDTTKLIHLFEEHFLFKNDIYQLSMIHKNLYFNLNYNLLLETELFKSGWPTLDADFKSKPEFILNCAGVAMHKLVTNAGLDIITTHSSKDEYYIPLTLDLDKIHPRLCGFPSIPISSLNTVNCDTLVTIRGNASIISLPELVRTWQAFECPMCGKEQVIAQEKYKEEVTPPSTCYGDCRCKREFIPLQASPFTRLEAFQTIHLSEGVRSTAKFEAGIQMIEVVLSNDLVDLFGIGSDISVTGILRVKAQEERRNSTQMFLDAISVSMLVLLSVYLRIFIIF